MRATQDGIQTECASQIVMAGDLICYPDKAVLCNTSAGYHMFRRVVARTVSQETIRVWRMIEHSGIIKLISMTRKS
jgi:hypothetical protein